MREATRLADAGELNVIVDPRVFTMETVSEAHAAIEKSDVRGKLVIEID